MLLEKLELIQAQRGFPPTRLSVGTIRHENHKLRQQRGVAQGRALCMGNKLLNLTNDIKSGSVHLPEDGYKCLAKTSFRILDSLII